MLRPIRHGRVARADGSAIRDFNYQRAAGLPGLAQTPYMLREERIEVAGDPLRGVILQPLLTSWSGTIFDRVSKNKV